MERLILKIAGIALEINFPLPEAQLPRLNKFISRRRYPRKYLWRLESQLIPKLSRYKETLEIRQKILKIKKRLQRFPELSRAFQEKKSKLRNLKLIPRLSAGKLSFYLNAPILIDRQRKKLSHSSLGNTGKTQGAVYSGLLTYAYAQLLALHQGALLHATGVIMKKKAYLFFGASGGGKSTVAGLSRKYRVLGDDIIALRKVSSSYRAFATPWKQGPFIRPLPSLSAPVAAVFFLKKSKKIAFRPLAPPEALARIISCHTHFFLYTEMPLVKKIFFSCAEFVKNTPAYVMEFQKDQDFWPDLDKVLRCPRRKIKKLE